MSGLRIHAWRAWRFVQRDVLTDLSYRVTFALGLVDGALMLLSYSFLARAFGSFRPDGYDAFGFLVVGIAASGALTTAVVCFSQGVRGTQVTGTIKAVMATPTPATTFLLLSSIYPMGRSIADALVLMGVSALLGVHLHRAGAVGAACVLMLGLFSMAVFGIVSAAFALVFKRGDPMTWMLGAVMWLLSGVLYPTTVLPPALAAIAWMLPTTHALSALRALLLTGVSMDAVRGDLIYLAVFATLGLPASLWIFSRSVNYAKREGTLGQF